MNYSALAKGGKYVFERYLLPYLKRQGMKKYVSERLDEAVDVDDFVEKYVFGIQSLNEPEEALDKEFASYIIQLSEEKATEIMQKNVGDWTSDDYHFLRGTVDFDQNQEKKSKVLEYLNMRKKK